MKTRLLPIFMALYCMTSSNVMANVATTAGSNLTAWNGNAGATNNNAWNTAMNNRTFATGPLGGSNAAVPRADFGNCNALIMRCAQPKCSGCTTMELAKPIVTGCVNSTDTCKKHGDELIEYISAQLVSDATAKATADANAANIAAANAAASAANNANNEQISQLQSQISQMAATQAESNRQMQQLTEQLQNATAQNNAAQNTTASAPVSTPDAPSPTTNSDTTSDTSDATQVFKSSQFSDVENIAKKYDIDPDMAVRTMITGEIMTDIENAKDAMTKLKAAMNETFKYAGCNQYGANCSGPHRVKAFKEKAYQYFEPYDEVADHIYSALESALMVGADVNDIIMMLAGGCERWARYICTTTSYANHKGGNVIEYVYPDFRYTATSCPDGKSAPDGTAQSIQHIKKDSSTDKSAPIEEPIIRGNMPCTVGAIIPPEDDARCRIAEVITDDNRETLMTEWDNEMQDEGSYVRIGCASNALGALARLNRRSSSTKKAMDIEILERMLAQDASDFTGRSASGLRNYGGRANADDAFDKYKYCALTVDGYNKLQTALAQRRMPAGEICMDYDDLFGHMYRSELIDWASISIDTTGSVDNGTYTVPNFTCAANECNEAEFNYRKTSCGLISVNCINCSGTESLQTESSCNTFIDTDKDNKHDSGCSCQIKDVESCEKDGRKFKCKKK
ncbi:MAG: hypothetical protein IKL37_01165 [Alphaproteobacteria bacterium]|nr:hypothetical protein [Alphaproteobacteria bacterium]